MFLPGFKNFSRNSLSPLFSLLFTYMAGLVVGLFWHPQTTIIFIVVCFVSVLSVYALLKKRLWLPIVALFGGLFLMGVISLAHYLRPDFPPHHVYCWAQNRPLTVEGFLYRPAEYLPQKTRLYIRAQWIIISKKKYPVTGNIFLTIEDARESFLVYDRLIFSARLHKPHNFGNPGGFDFVRWLAFQDIYVTGYVSREQGLVRLGLPQSRSWLRKIDTFRSTIREIIDSSTSPPINSFLRALLLGEQSAIPDEINESFIRTGTAHILAISGLNVGIVAAFFYFLFRRLLGFSEFLLLKTNVPKFATALSVLPVLFYVLIAGAGVSVQRAFIMTVAYIAALLFNRERDLYHATAFAALVILVIQPPALFGASFQLSFVSVLGIVLFAPKILSLLPQHDKLLQKLEPPWWRRLKHQPLVFMVVTFSAMLATAPLVAYYFSLFSFSGLVANLLIVPLAGFLIVVLGLIGVLLIPFSAFVAGFIFYLSGLLSDITIKIATFLANIPWTIFLVPTPTLITVFLSYFFILALFCWKFYGWPKKIIFISSVLLIVNFFYHHFHVKPPALFVTFIDVGQGDSAFIRFPEGKTMLIDGGGFPNGDFDTGKNIVTPFLLGQGVWRIDYLVLTHPHPDHYYGLRYIAKNFSIREFWTNGDTVDDPCFLELGKILAQRKVIVRKLNSSSPEMLIQGVSMGILHPPPAYSGSGQGLDARLNNNSLVIKLSYGGIGFLFSGDIGVDAEKMLLLTGKDLSADVFKIPHHGSTTSSSIPFINSVGPRVAICSVGFRNPFNLPHLIVLERFQKKGCAIYRTDLNGAVTIATEGKELQVQGLRQDRKPGEF
jgi:competence protein ComEC